MVALQGLYELDMQRDLVAEQIPAMMAPLLAEAGLQGEAADYARQLVAGAWASHERYDQMIAGASDHWDVSRMAVVDRNILRIAAGELLYEPTLVPAIVMNEAIEIAKRYSGEESAVFVNGVLDAVVRRLKGAGAAEAGPVQEGEHEQKRGTRRA